MIGGDYTCNHLEWGLRTEALKDVIGEVGVDRVLYSVDYPFEDMIEAKEWFDRAPIGEADQGGLAASTRRGYFEYTCR